MLDTGLKEQIPVSSEGLKMVEQRITDIQGEITKGIERHAAQGRTVDTANILKAMDGLEDFYRNTAAPEKSLKILDELRFQFGQYHGQQIPIDVAQKIKVNTYQELKAAYGEMANAKVEGLKQVARGLKDEISSVFPEIAGLNERQSELIGLDEALTRAVWRIENHQLMGIGSGIAGAAGGAIAGGPGAAGAFVSKLLMDDPVVKSKLAIALAKAGTTNAPKLVNMRMAALRGAMEKAASAVAASHGQSTPAAAQ